MSGPNLHEPLDLHWTSKMNAMSQLDRHVTESESLDGGGRLEEANVRSRSGY